MILFNYASGNIIPAVVDNVSRTFILVFKFLTVNVVFYKLSLNISVSEGISTLVLDTFIALFRHKFN